MPSLASTRAPLVIGIDLGTQGVRALAVDAAGQVVARATSDFPLAPPSASGRFEQDPQHWWDSTVASLRHLLAASGIRPHQVQALAVTATSGTVCLLDGAGTPVYPAIMYSDRRAEHEAAWLNQVERVGRVLNARLGYRFNSSFALPKLLWMRHHEPEVFRSARSFAHAGDVITGHLTGNDRVTDWSQALKSGYDLIEQRWPDVLMSELPRDMFPEVVAPGMTIGLVTARAAQETGLPVGVPVVAGMTDGCAAQVAGGAVEPGQWLSVLGTTLVVKGVSTDLLLDPAGRIYSHRHPAGLWLPGGASNTGGEVLAQQFANDDLAALDEQAARLTPSGIVCYPLQRTGERFPFACSSAEGFVLGRAERREQHYTACLEGFGYVERMAYEVLEQLGATVEGAIRVTGGGARSRVWLQIRANILNCPLVVPEQTDGAFGAAVLAASGSLYPDLITATRHMVRMREEILPQAHAEEYTAGYERFVGACRERGYLE